MYNHNFATARSSQCGGCRPREEQHWPAGLHPQWTVLQPGGGLCAAGHLCPSQLCEGGGGGAERPGGALHQQGGGAIKYGGAE